MTNQRISMNCEQFADTLADFLERDVSEATRAGIEAHALACAECGPLLADLRALRIGAANLPELAPSRDLWKGIAARIETPVVELKNGSAAVVRRSGARRERLWMGLAAAGLVAVTATVTHELTKRTVVASVPTTVAVAKPSVPSPSAPTDTSPSQASAPVQRDIAPAPQGSAARPTASLAANDRAADQTYDSEIARLRVVVDKRRPQLDSATVAVIEHNLKVIDDAISQCRDALRKDPGSRFLLESLNDALDNKVQLLRTAATLPSKA